MPLYAYACAKCQHIFELSLSFAEYDTAKPACPKCKSKKVKRHIGSIGQSHTGKATLTREQLNAALHYSGLESGGDSHEHHHDN